ncbi:SAM-dependent methyltransferase [Massilia arenosa]|uniref:site-specific DNA-methyltransferase (adenine-specific) n=1 Tax=Zemynaea arenosa TaxID=2561931 RepID=A0A4Y9SV07_9BURK|nr:N-6 DNA methylase [Massilia arenosa]TFW30268.1 SAM-dependent methyltransferase [Massilia arenosa]
MNRTLHTGEDTAAARKSRGAFFTPDAITAFIANWALRSSHDRVLEPSAGDAAFLVAAVHRLRELAPRSGFCPELDGVELHEDSAGLAHERVAAAGGKARIRNCDFFALAPDPVYDAVIGNPPYIRYQGFAGESRRRAREAALRGGVALTGLASSWAAFTIHSAMFLKPGGRLAMVLPAELLSVNYAGPVRRFLFERFRKVQLVLFEKQVFPDAEADVILLLADGFGEGPAGHAHIRQARDAAELQRLGDGLTWTPADPAGKWTSSLIDPDAISPLQDMLDRGRFTRLDQWGDTTLGIVTGNNKYFALSPQRVKELGLPRHELLRLSPPGSAHLRGLSLSAAMLAQLGKQGQSTYLFCPGDQPSAAAAEYIDSGHRAGVATAYKCRVRKTWYKVPLVPPADLLLTCMNADTPRLVTNEANASHLNSVHGVYFSAEHRALGRELLPLASLNSITLLHAEIVGRSYGGGILKIEPKEADVWAVPSPSLVAARAAQLRQVLPQVARLLHEGALLKAVDVVDQVLLAGRHLPAARLRLVQRARSELAQRRTERGRSGK